MQADMVLLNGKVYSVSSNDKEITGEAVAVKDGLIAYVGSNDEIKAYITDATEIIDCHGNTILPGLCDAHCHPSIAASVLAACDLFGIYRQEDETPEEILQKYLDRLEKFVKEHPDDKLIRGSGWVYWNFPEDKMPTRHDIDRICSDRPVVLESFCQHNIWVNTKAIELSGIDANTPDVEAGMIFREPDGTPSGVFREPEAMNLVKLKVPGYDFSVEQYKEAFIKYQKECANQYGVTLIQDCMHTDQARQAYIELAKEGKLTMRVRGAYLLEPAECRTQLPEYIARKGTDDVGEDFKIRTVKMFAEGNFVLEEPYEKAYLSENDLPDDYNGDLFFTDEDFTYCAAKAMESGFQVHVHAMGDKSVKQSVRCLSEAQKKAGIRERNAIAHLMLVKDEDAKLMGEAGIIANCQARWMVYDSDIDALIPQAGLERSISAYPYRKFIDAGVTVAFGTDFPVTPPPDTMHEIQCAMTRSVFPDAPDYGKYKGKVLGDEKPATLKEAVKALSINGAYQMYEENLTGSIETGKSAELVILDSDIENTPVEEIYKIRVEKTIFKGKVVFQRKQ